MKYILIVGFILTSLILSKTALATNCESTCQLEQINLYFSALDKVSRKNSSINDIDSLLALTHDDVKYIHVEYQANFTKTTWREAFVRNLKRGAYQDSEKSQIRVLKFIFGKSHTAIEYSNGVIQQDGTWQQT